MDRGRPKSQIPRTERLNMRFTKFEYEKISRIAKEKNLTRTEAILKGIELLEKNKPQRIANIKEIKRKHGTIFDDDDND